MALVVRRAAKAAPKDSLTDTDTFGIQKKGAHNGAPFLIKEF